MTLSLILDSPPADVSCKGRYYRYIQTAFQGKAGRIVLTRELRPLKSISCPGCNHCYGLDDDLMEGLSVMHEGFIEFDASLVHGDTVTLRMVELGRDWESGNLESWMYRAVKVPPPSKPTAAAPAVAQP